MVHKTITKHVQINKGISDRLAYLVLKMSRTSIKSIYIYSYSSISAYDVENIKIYYEDISKAIEDHRNRLTLVMGNFTVKLNKNLNEKKFWIQPAK